MIERAYFFVASYADEMSQAKAHGIVTVRSWLGDQKRAMAAALDRLCLDYGWPRDEILLERFNRC